MVHSDEYCEGYNEGYENGYKMGLKNAKKWQGVYNIPKEKTPLLIKTKDICGFNYHSGYYDRKIGFYEYDYEYGDSSGRYKIKSVVGWMEISE